MNRGAVSIPPLLAFAALDGDRWGVVAGADPAQVALGSSDAPDPVPVEPGTVEQTAPDQWSLRRGEEVLPVVEEPADVVAADGDPGFRLVRVSGPLDGAGIAFAADAEVQADSARILFVQFPNGRATGILAVRPSRAKGQDRDAMSVSCLGEASGHRVFDPRLSSTYGDGGLLRRVGVELWLGASEEADLHSLRVAGEAGRAVARLENDGAIVQAQPITCHSRGESGVGVYVLVTRP